MKIDEIRNQASSVFGINQILDRAVAPLDRGSSAKSHDENARHQLKNTYLVMPHEIGKNTDGIDRPGRRTQSAASRAAFSFQWAGQVLMALLLALALWTDSAAAAEKLTAESVNDAEFSDYNQNVAGPSAAIVKVQVMLDRANISPGVIDGWYGQSVKKALEVFQAVNGLPNNGKLNQETWKVLAKHDTPPILAGYQIDKADVKGPFAETIPNSFEKMAERKSLPYTGPEELLAEKFHMDQDLLKNLNPEAEWKAGETITVAQPGGEAKLGKIERIDIDKKRGGVLVYGEDDRLIAFYPASIGSKETPSPNGTYEVRAVAPNPVYYYLPDVNPSVKRKTEKRLEIPPGPNNPVGSMWIDLTRETFGIHGTPEPDKVDKIFSNGCVRLTNWDVEELGHAVEKGTPVAFLEQPASLRKVAAAAKPHAEDEVEAEARAGIVAKKNDKAGREVSRVEPIGGADEEKKLQLCLKELDRLGVKYSVLSPIEGDDGCGVDKLIKLQQLASGVKVRPAATVNCAMARALTVWEKKVLLPAAKEQLNASPEVVYIGGSYECRGQNRQSEVKMSEHSFANAVDVMAVGFKKQTVFIKEHQDEAADVSVFQRLIRTRACDYFTTVLGPSTDEPHKDHLHFDLRQRENDFKICQ